MQSEVTAASSFQSASLRPALFYPPGLRPAYNRCSGVSLASFRASRGTTTWGAYTMAYFRSEEQDWHGNPRTRRPAKR